MKIKQLQVSTRSGTAGMLHRESSVSRVRAAIIHLLASIGVIGVGFGSLFWLWYWPGLWGLAGIPRALWMLLIGVVFSGPLMTLVVFRPGKPRLRTDMAVIATIQIAFLGFSVFAFARIRPIFLVAATDRFEFVRAAELDPKDLAVAQGEYRHPSWTGPRVVGIKTPEGSETQFQLIISALGGKDVHLMPQLYASYQVSAEEIASRALPISQLLVQDSRTKQYLGAILSNAGRTEIDTSYVPIRGPNFVASIMLVDRYTGQVLLPVAVDPWRNEAPSQSDDIGH